MYEQKSVLGINFGAQNAVYYTSTWQKKFGNMLTSVKTGKILWKNLFSWQILQQNKISVKWLNFKVLQEIKKSGYGKISSIIWKMYCCKIWQCQC